VHFTIRGQEDAMRKRPVLTALVIFAVTGAINHSQNLAEARQGDLTKNLSGMMTNAAHVNNDRQQESLIHKMADASSGMGPVVRPGGYQQGPLPYDQSRPTGEYKAGSPGSETRYGPNPSDNYMKKESSGPSSGPYGGAVYGGPPATPSADPMIKELSRDSSMR
jgi:hypothetical protein